MAVAVGNTYVILVSLFTEKSREVFFFWGGGGAERKKERKKGLELVATKVWVNCMGFVDSL
jgi:hypothetical protein